MSPDALFRLAMPVWTGRFRMPALVALVAVAALLAPRATFAAEPRIGAIVLSHEKDARNSEDSFESDTPRIYLAARLIDLPQGARVASSWIAVATGVAPPDYLIDSAEVAVSGRVNVANFSLSRPNNGWPPGSYRVDLSIDGSKAGSASFSIKP